MWGKESFIRIGHNEREDNKASRQIARQNHEKTASWIKKRSPGRTWKDGINGAMLISTSSPPFFSDPVVSGKRLFYDTNENIPSRPVKPARDVTTPRLQPGSGERVRQSILPYILGKPERRASDTWDTLFEMLLGSFRSSQQRIGDAAPRRSIFNPPIGMHKWRRERESTEWENGNAKQQAHLSDGFFTAWENRVSDLIIAILHRMRRQQRWFRI